MHKELWICFLAALLVSALPAWARPAMAARSDACSAALKPEVYVSLPVIPDSLKDAIRLYRRDWLTLCSTKNSNVTLSALFHQAQKIEAQFDDVFRRTHGETDKTKDETERYNRLDEVAEYIRTTLPSFVPAFEGSLYTYEFFRPSVAAFRQNVDLGTAEDRLFFNGYAALLEDAEFSPWIEKTWDYGGCYRYGEYDWVDALTAVRKLRQSLASPVYLKLVNEFEADLVGVLSIDDRSANDNYGYICTCHEPQAVLQDLTAVRDYLYNQGTDASQGIDRTINAIRSGRLGIKSQKEKHCSGG